jgi:hypothetical protein
MSVRPLLLTPMPTHHVSLIHAVRGILVAMLVVGAFPPTLWPQRMRGEVVLADSISRAAGVIVILTPQLR